VKHEPEAVPATFVGCINPVGIGSVFLIPVFLRPQITNELLHQVIGRGGRVERFVPFEAGAATLVDTSHDIQLSEGDDAIWSYEFADGQIVTGSRAQVIDSLRSYRDAGHFAGAPFALLDAAMFCEWRTELQDALRAGHELLAEFPGRSADLWRDGAILLPAYRRMIEPQLRASLDQESFQRVMEEMRATVEDSNFVVWFPPEARQVFKRVESAPDVDAAERTTFMAAIGAFGAGQIVLKTDDDERLETNCRGGSAIASYKDAIAILESSKWPRHVVLAENLRIDERVSTGRREKFESTWQIFGRTAAQIYASFEVWTERHVRRALVPEFESAMNANNWILKQFEPPHSHPSLRLRQFLNLPRLMLRMAAQPDFHGKAGSLKLQRESDYVQFLDRLDAPERLAAIERVLKIAEIGGVPTRHPTWLTPVPLEADRASPEVMLAIVGIPAADQYWIELHYSMHDLSWRREILAIPTVLDGGGVYFYPTPPDYHFNGIPRSGFSMNLCRLQSASLPVPQFIKATRPTQWLQAWIDGGKTIHRTRDDVGKRVHLIKDDGDIDFFELRRRHAGRLGVDNRRA
jgi:hypothetical protein